MLTDNQDNRWLTVQESAGFYGCSRQNIHGWIKRGLIPEAAIRRVGNLVLIDRSALIDAIRRVRPNHKMA